MMEQASGDKRQGRKRQEPVTLSVYVCVKKCHYWMRTVTKRHVISLNRFKIVKLECNVFNKVC